MNITFSKDCTLHENEYGIHFIDAIFECFEKPSFIWKFRNHKILKTREPVFDDSKRMIYICYDDGTVFSAYTKAIRAACEKGISNVAMPILQTKPFALGNFKKSLESSGMNIGVRLIFNREFLTNNNKTSNRLIDYYVSVTYKYSGVKFSLSSRLDSLNKRIEKAEKKMDAPFQKQLFDYIDCKKLNDVDVYKKANIDRRLFSKIRSNPDYRPSKDTVIALCLSMKLTLEESEALLKTVGASFSNSILRDVIIKACIKYEIYNVDDVNLLLIERNLEPLSNY